MNERIRELAEQAEEIVFHSPSTGRTTKQLNIEKFAKLIALECARLAMNQRLSTNTDDYDEMKPYRQGRDDMASNISGLIRRTFGVEE